MRIRNWRKFQHFKDRRPPWVKLYRDVLDDLEWHRLDGDSAKTLVMLWLLASEGDDGELPAVDEIAFRLRISEKQVQTTVEKLRKWVEQTDSAPPDITAISPRYQDGSPETETETETEGETETEARRRAVFSKPTVSDVSGYCRERSNAVDPDAFVDFYESVGWRVGNKPMKDWKAAVRTWEKRHEKPNGASRKPVFEQPHERRARELREYAARAEGRESVGEASGNLRGQVLPGVWERAK